MLITGKELEQICDLHPANDTEQYDGDDHRMLIESCSTKPPLMDEKAALHSATHVGSDYLGWLHFQPVYDQVVAANPDMFD